jgi:hypothetical protein
MLLCLLIRLRDLDFVVSKLTPGMITSLGYKIFFLFAVINGIGNTVFSLFVLICSIFQQL